MQVKTPILLVALSSLVAACPGQEEPVKAEGEAEHNRPSADGKAQAPKPQPKVNQDEAEPVD